ncbi:prepilin peptidase [Vibrio fluvialis]|nr:prepilin peptidase [Vibrio fluvialis]MBY7864113.1 prepilin peptidase [Vibrio fluvialis]
MISIAVWVLLLLIGVFDAREFRIPNYLLMLLMVFVISELYLSSDSQWDAALAKQSGGLLVMLIVGILLYLLKVVAAGDSKLMAVIGFLLGFENLTLYAICTCFVCCVVGACFWSLDVLASGAKDSTCKPLKESRVIDSDMNSLKRYYNFETPFYRLSSTLASKKQLTYMPFGPSLIIGFAMTQYLIR